MKTEFDKILAKVNYFHFNHQEALIREIEKYEKLLLQILAIRLSKNTREIILMSERVIHHHYLTALLKMNGTFQKENISSKIVTKGDLVKNVNIPSHEPLNLTEHQIELHLSELWSKRPSFIQKPSSVNWHVLLKDFDNFKDKLTCKVHFYDTSNETELTKDGIKPPIIKSQSNKVAPKCKIPEEEKLLSRTGQDIFRDTLRKK